MGNNDTINGSKDTMIRDDPAEMDLDELREEIRSIDREIVEQIAQRTYVAESIAAVKREKGLPTTDESQERLWSAPARTPSSSMSMLTSSRLSFGS